MLSPKALTVFFLPPTALPSRAITFSEACSEQSPNPSMEANSSGWMTPFRLESRVIATAWVTASAPGESATLSVEEVLEPRVVQEAEGPQQHQRHHEIGH
jgi:hypothetical protein